MNVYKVPKSSNDEKRANIEFDWLIFNIFNYVKLGNKERFDKEQIGIKEPFPMTNLPFTS